MSATASIDAVGSEQAARAAGIVNGVGSLGQLISAYVACSVAAGSLLTLRWNKGVQ